MYNFDESKFLSFLCRNKSAYFAIREMGLKPWFWETAQNREIWAKLAHLVDSSTYDTYKAHVVRLAGEISKNFEFLMRLDITELERDWKDDDFLVLNDVKSRVDDRRRIALYEIMGEVEKRIAQKRSYQDLLLAVSELNDQSMKSDGRNAREIAEDIENETEGEVFRTGLEDFDKIVKTQMGYFFVVSGESSTGKTSWAVQMMYNFVVSKPHYKAVFYSLETSQVRLGKRMVQHIRFKEHCENPLERLRALDDRFVVVKNLHSVDAIVEDLKSRIKADDAVKIVCVDYIQIVQATGFHKADERVGYVADVLHKLTQETGVLFICISQLRKQEVSGKATERKKVEPTMNDLRGSGQIANCADVITINWSEKVNDTAPVKPINIQIVKNKDGAQGRVKCDFIGKYFSFCIPEEGGE